MLAAAQAPAPAEALAIAITMEGLLFAAFAMADKLTESTKRGRHVFFTQAWFGWCIVGVLTFIALAGCASWVETFGIGWPSTVGEGLLAFGLVLGILTQPVFAAIINWQSKAG